MRLRASKDSRPKEPSPFKVGTPPLLYNFNTYCGALFKKVLPWRMHYDTSNFQRVNLGNFSSKHEPLNVELARVNRNIIMYGQGAP